jgi:hypothetical protein
MLGHLQYYVASLLNTIDADCVEGTTAGQLTALVGPVVAADAAPHDSADSARAQELNGARTLVSFSAGGGLPRDKRDCPCEPLFA